ncbi:hypothetical protein [Serratia fonticola]|uniref:hypothetical protein n=1 Tax=Serratia fonticola TaxID=47917 RepID=UPI0021AE31F4|nr:hypothetical protein [Serratia fonticola]
MSELTAEEKKWVKQVNALLKKCPSKRIGFLTIGDPVITLFDDSYRVADTCDGDLIPALNARGLMFGESLYFPSPVNGVCG